MSNHHFKERGLSLKAKGLLSLMLSLPNDWNYSVSGLVTLSKDGKDSVMAGLAELEAFGYLHRERVTNSKGQFNGIEYNIYEQPQEKPIAEKPTLAKSNAEKPSQLITNELNKKELNTDNYIYREQAINSVKDFELRNLYQDYVDMRDEIGAPISVKGIYKLIDRNERLTNGDIYLQGALLEAAIINQWKNIYLPNEQDVMNNSKLANLKRLYNLQ
jgi:hypothetical protein